MPLYSPSRSIPCSSERTSQNLAPVRLSLSEALICANNARRAYRSGYHTESKANMSVNRLKRRDTGCNTLDQSGCGRSHAFCQRKTRQQRVLRQLKTRWSECSGLGYIKTQQWLRRALTRFLHQRRDDSRVESRAGKD